MLAQHRLKPRYPRTGPMSVIFVIAQGLATASPARAAVPPCPPLAPAAVVTSAGIEIQWDAPAECPDAAQVRRDTERLLGRPLDAARSQRISARARVRKNEQQNYELELSLAASDGAANEVLVARACSALADATALKIALASDPFAVVAAIRAPEERLGSNENASPERAPWVAGDRDVPRAPPPAVRIGLRIAAGASFGPLPNTAPGGAIVGSIQLPAWRLELGAHVFGNGEARYVTLPDVGAHLQLFSALVRACVTPALGPAQFPICAGIEGGVMRGEGFGAPTSQTATSAWGGVVVGPAIRLPIAHNWSLWLEADAILPVVRPGFHFRNLETLYVSPSGASRAWAGIELVLP